MSDLTNNFMGVDFDYSNAIHKPRDSNNGPSMGTRGLDIVNNMKGMIDYGMLLVKQDNSNDRKRVQKTRGKLGNQYFINTNTQCNNGNSKYIFIIGVIWYINFYFEILEAIFFENISIVIIKKFKS